MNAPEANETFDCFGGSATVLVGGRGPGGPAAVAATLAKRRLLEWHQQFSRFEPESELSKLNEDPRETVPVSPVMARLIAAIIDAARSSGGLIDGSLVGELERAGYAEHLELDSSVPLATALARAPARAPAGPRPQPLWEIVSLDPRAGTVTRPAGLRFDSGGIAKGLFGDILTDLLEMHPSFALDCSGDVRFGGSAGLRRSVDVASPFADSIIHRFELTAGAVATSGIGRRSWIDADGRPTHHLLDAASGRPAFTGIVQVTAIAPSGVEAEILAKTALLRGPAAAAATLRHGGAVVYDDGRLEIV
ncbi:MAG: FAD:protein FMN transferase [Solirubrobacteraceae bacterium]